jgi:hypothetical protein
MQLKSEAAGHAMRAGLRAEYRQLAGEPVITVEHKKESRPILHRDFR